MAFPNLSRRIFSAAKLLTTEKRDAAVVGPSLREAHRRIRRALKVGRLKVTCIYNADGGV